MLAYPLNGSGMDGARSPPGYPAAPGTSTFLPPPILPPPTRAPAPPTTASPALPPPPSRPALPPPMSTARPLPPPPSRPARPPPLAVPAALPPPMTQNSALGAQPPAVSGLPPPILSPRSPLPRPLPPPLPSPTAAGTGTAAARPPLPPPPEFARAPQPPPPLPLPPPALPGRPPPVTGAASSAVPSASATLPDPLPGPATVTPRPPALPPPISLLPRPLPPAAPAGVTPRPPALPPPAHLASQARLPLPPPVLPPSPGAAPALPASAAVKTLPPPLVGSAAAGASAAAPVQVFSESAPRRPAPYGSPAPAPGNSSAVAVPPPRTSTPASLPPPWPDASAAATGAASGASYPLPSDSAPVVPGPPPPAMGGWATSGVVDITPGATSPSPSPPQRRASRVLLSLRRPTLPPSPLGANEAVTSSAAVAVAPAKGWFYSAEEEAARTGDSGSHHPAAPDVAEAPVRAMPLPATPQGRDTGRPRATPSVPPAGSQHGGSSGGSGSSGSLFPAPSANASSASLYRSNKPAKAASAGSSSSWALFAAPMGASGKAAAAVPPWHREFWTGRRLLIAAAVAAVLLILLIAIPVAVTSGHASSGAPAVAVERGLWVWAYDGCFFDTFGAHDYAGNCGYSNFTLYMEAYFTMVHAPWHGRYPGFTRLFMVLPVGDLSSNNSESVRQALRYAHDEGVLIEYLQSGSAWVKSTEGVATALNICQEIAWFNGNATDPRDVLDGAHFDIEPHTLGPGWFQNTSHGSDRYNDAWEANLMSILGGCRSIFSGTKATVAWDVPDDYYPYVTDVWIPLVRDPFVDYLLIMNYHNSTEELIYGVGGVGGVANVLASLNGSVPALFGVELQHPPEADYTISFWSQGLAPAEAAIAEVAATFSGHPLYMGNAVDLAATYWALPAAGGGDVAGTSPLLSFCSSMGRVLFAYSNSSDYVSMRVYDAVTGGLLSVNDISGYVPGPWSMPLFSDGPYRLEYYDGPNGDKATNSSTVGEATCTVLIPS